MKTVKKKILQNDAQLSEEASDFSAAGRTGTDESSFDLTSARPPSPVGLATQHAAAAAAADVGPDASYEDSSMGGGAIGSTASFSASRGGHGDAMMAMASPSTKAQLMAKRRAEADEKHAKMEEEIIAAGERRRAGLAAANDAAFQEMFASVMEGIEGRGLLAEVDDVLRKTDAAKAKKTREIHAEWDEVVFQTIQKQIMRYVDGLDPRALTERLAHHYDAFLDVVNAKQEKNAKSGVFCDVLLVQEYDPLLQRKDAVKYRVNSLDDPTKRDVYKPLKEKLQVGLLRRAAARAGVTVRETLDTLHWTNLEATPYGWMTDGVGEAKPPHVGEHSHKRGASGVVMDAYDVPTGVEVLDKELPLRKGTVAPAGHRVGRPDLHDLVNHRVDHASGFTGGDMWLEFKGKKVPGEDMPVPGLSEERKDLFDVVNMCSDPKDNRPQGDLWLSAKGRKVVLPPSVIYSDRKSLHETIQQSAPKFERVRPDQTCGDLWLDAKGKGPVPGVKESGVQGGLYTVLVQTEQKS